MATLTEPQDKKMFSSTKDVYQGVPPDSLVKQMRKVLVLVKQSRIAPGVPRRDQYRLYQCVGGKVFWQPVEEVR